MDRETLIAEIKRMLDEITNTDYLRRIYYFVKPKHERNTKDR